MDDPNTPVSLAELDVRLKAMADRRHQEQRAKTARRSFLPAGTVEFAGRVGNDLVAAALIAVAVGAAIDAGFSTWPWGLVGMFALGAVAAVRNLYRTATRMADSERPAPATGPAGSPFQPVSR